jgi:hypothetical protein
MSAATHEHLLEATEDAATEATACSIGVVCVCYRSADLLEARAPGSGWTARPAYPGDPHPFGADIDAAQRDARRKESHEPAEPS